MPTQHIYLLHFSEAKTWYLLYYRLSFSVFLIAYRPAKWIPE
jgi:hypothetical protein